MIDANRNATRVNNPNRINNILHSVVRSGLVDGDESRTCANFEFLVFERFLGFPKGSDETGMGRRTTIDES